MKKYIIFTLLVISLLSCTKTIDFDDEEFANQLVLNSILSPDSVFTASFTKSASILENDYGPSLPVIDGVLDLYENDQLLAHLNSSTGAFRATGIKPKAGNTYKIVATSGAKQVIAQTIIPYSAEVVAIDTSIIGNSNNYNTIHFKIQLKDTPGEDYYRLTILHEYLVVVTYPDENYNKKPANTYYLYKESSQIQSDDPVFKSVYNNSGGEIFDMGPENRYHIFPDQLFEGKVHSVRVSSTYFHNYFNPTDPNLYGIPRHIYDRFTVYVQHLSKDLYNYLKYLELYDYYHDNPIAEPVPVYSNVGNGAGILAGYNGEASMSIEKTHIPYSMDTIQIKNTSNGGGYGGYGY